MDSIIRREVVELLAPPDQELWRLRGRVGQLEVQRRVGSGKVRNHVTRELPPLSEARVRKVPAKPCYNWRDLPNMEVKLRDGSWSNKLEYKYRDEAGALTGVCPCVDGVSSCDPASRQANTLIYFQGHDRHWSL